jgi:hypothetical protein
MWHEWERSVCRALYGDVKKREHLKDIEIDGCVI